MSRYEEIFARHARMIQARTDGRLDDMGVLALCGTGLPGELAELSVEEVGTKDHTLEVGDFLWYAHRLTLQCGFQFVEIVKLALAAKVTAGSHGEKSFDSFVLIGNISDMLKKIAVTKRRELDDDAKKAIALKLSAAMAYPLSHFYQNLDSTEVRLDKVADILLANIEKLQEKSNEVYR